MMHEIIIAPSDAAENDASVSQRHLSYHNNLFWSKKKDFSCKTMLNIIKYFSFKGYS